MGNREGKRRGGLLAWHTRTPEQQAAILERLRAAGGRQANTSAKARAAQGRRAKAYWDRRAPMSAAKAALLAEMGILDRVPLAGPPPLGLPAGRPRPADYADSAAWALAVNEWDRAEWWRKQQAERAAEEDGDGAA